MWGGKSNGSEMLGFSCFPKDSYCICMCIAHSGIYLFFGWLNSNKRIFAELFAIRKTGKLFHQFAKKNYNYYHPVPKTRKKPGAGGLRVRRASATM